MFTKSEKRLLVLLVFCHFCLILDFMILMPMGPLFMRIFGVDTRAFGFLVAGFTLMAGLSGIIGMLWMDRFDRKLTLLWIVGGFFVSNLMCGFATSYTALIVGRAVTGFFAGACGSLLITIVSDAIALEKRGTALGWLMSAFALASILGVPLALWMANHFGWQSPFFLLSTLSLVLLLWIHKGLGSMRDHLKGWPEGNGSAWSFLKTAANQKGYWTSVAFMIFLIVGHFSINPFLFTSIVANGGMAEEKLPIVYLAAGLASLVTAIIFGRVTDRFGREKTFHWTLLGSLLPIYLVTNVFSSSVAVVTLLVSLFFILMGGRMTPAMTFVTAVARPEDRGRYLSCIVSVQHLATAGASMLAGSILATNQDGKLQNLPLVGYVAIASSLFALFLFRRTTSR